MHTTSLLTKAVYDGYLRYGLIPPDAPAALDLKQARATTHYIWRTRRDGRVRPSHAENDGKVFAWDSPPPTGHPGDAPGCRCTAEPYSPPINEHMRMLFYGVSGWWPGWHNIDFINHFYFGRGRTVRLRNTGHLQRVVDEYWPRRGDAVLSKIAEEACKNPGGSFRHTFGRPYSMTNIVFSLGSSTIGGDALGASKWRSDSHLNISGQCNFFLRDEFVDPLDLGVESPLFSTYKIIDDWMGLFSGTVHVDRR